MLEKFHIYLTPFKQERMIRVYLPQAYQDANIRYPVLYMHDGQNVFQDEDAIGGVSLGIEEHLDKSDLEIIVVGIDSNPSKEERANEYCPWISGEYSKRILGYECSLGGKGEEYLDFIVNELKPLIDEKYRTLQNHTAMAGISLGGLLSTYAAGRYPEIFSNIAVLSSAYYRNQEKIMDLLGRSDLASIKRFYMDCGSTEAGDDNISKEFLTSNKDVFEIIKGKVAISKFTTVENAEHNYIYFRKRVPEIFSFLFR